MWMVDPKIMCRNHLLGEHSEIHMFACTIEAGRSIKGYIEKGLLEIHNLYNRHEALAHELRSRGYQHNSKLAEKWKMAKVAGVIDREKSLRDLIERCPGCRARYQKLARAKV
ncbi:MAG: pyrimidine dimer DNA glycosylase/endonuclease V [Candidatus Bathyarchaeota archaeon]|nr:pyrimidine dimer DNA glycosylase/endonuclease V [Candidatus Bathyarchaeota archaeon]